MKLSEVPGGDAPSAGTAPTTDTSSKPGLKLSDIPAALPTTGTWGSFLKEHLPSSLYGLVPSAFTGPSVGEQLANVRQRTVAKEKELGRPLTLRERSAIEPVTQSPVAMGFTTGELGVAEPAAGLSGGATKSVLKEYKRAAKPPVTVSRTAPERARYEQQVQSGLASIIGNKENLRFVDAAGNVAEKQLPTSLEQFGDAINQTKARKFQEYDAMAQQAGGQGARIDLTPMIGELQTALNDVFVRDWRPQIANYIQDRITQLQRIGSYSVVDAQHVIQGMNEELKAFYRNPTREMVVPAQIDALVAARMRSLLDDSISQYAGPGYQELRNDYGALKAMEEHVNKRAGVVGRQEKGGGLGGRLFDTVSAVEFIHGLTSFSPEAFATAVGVKALNQYIQHLRSPNRAVTKLFREVAGGEVPSRRTVPETALRGGLSSGLTPQQQGQQQQTPRGISSYVIPDVGATFGQTQLW